MSLPKQKSGYWCQLCQRWHRNYSKIGKAHNIFRQAAELLDKKHDYRLTEEEDQLINTAIIPLMTTKVFPKDITLREGLEELAKLVGEAGGSGVAG